MRSKVHDFTLLAEILYPEGALPDELSKAVIKGNVCQSLATHMNGVGYDGRELCTNLQNPAVILTPYKLEDVARGFVFFVRITGHDYPTRMATMEQRLDAIVRDFENALRWLKPPIDAETFEPYEKMVKPALVAAMFVPIVRGCLVSSRT